jgi:AmmeMemoRadiSam system protein A
MSHPEDEGDASIPGPADYAFSCVRSSVSGGRPPEPPGDTFYEHPSACFVTLKKNGELRGCIGTLEPAETSLGWEIARNAHSSAMRDPRFPPVTIDEVEALTCSVDVLGSSEPCTVADLDSQTYGVIVEAGFRRGVLLPALSGVDTVDLQVSIARQKAGIADDEPFDVRRFRVTRYRQGDAPAAADDPVGAPSDD